MGPACALIGASYTGCNRNATFALVDFNSIHLICLHSFHFIFKQISISTALNGAVYSGFMVSTCLIVPLDLFVAENVSDICR